MRPAIVPGPIWRTTRTSAVRAATMTSACPPRRSIWLTARSKPPPARDLVARSGVLSPALDGSLLSVPRPRRQAGGNRRVRVAGIDLRIRVDPELFLQSALDEGLHLETTAVDQLVRLERDAHEAAAPAHAGGHGDGADVDGGQGSERSGCRAVRAGADGRDRFGRAEGEFPDGGMNTVAGRRRLSRARQLRQRRGGDADRQEIAPFHVAYSYPC